MVTAILLLSVAVAYGDEFRRTVMQVSGMRCGSCLRVIDSELHKLPGVAGMTASFRERLVTVDHEIALSTEEISDVIAGLGYTATVVSSELLAAEEVKPFQRAGFGTGSGCCNPGGTNPVAESWKELRRRIFRKGGNAEPGS